jgi:hypothetical protein
MLYYMQTKAEQLLVWYDEVKMVNYGILIMLNKILKTVFIRGQQQEKKCLILKRNSWHTKICFFYYFVIFRRQRQRERAKCRPKERDDIISP